MSDFKVTINGVPVVPRNWQIHASWGSTDATLELDSKTTVNLGDEIVFSDKGKKVMAGDVRAISISGGTTTVDASSSHVISTVSKTTWTVPLTPPLPKFKYGDVVRYRGGRPSDRHMVIATKGDRVATVILDDNDGSHGGITSLYSDRLMKVRAR